MEGFPIAVAMVQLRLRHARSLKDKRHVVSGLMQKLKNAGFSVTEVAHQDDPKLSHLGVSYAARDTQQVGHAFKELDRFLLGDFEVLGVFREQIDYEPEFNLDQPWYTYEENPENPDSDENEG